MYQMSRTETGKKTVKLNTHFIAIFTFRFKKKVLIIFREMLKSAGGSLGDGPACPLLKPIPCLCGLLATPDKHE